MADTPSTGIKVPKYIKSCEEALGFQYDKPLTRVKGIRSEPTLAGLLEGVTAIIKDCVTHSSLGYRFTATPRLRRCADKLFHRLGPRLWPPADQAIPFWLADARVDNLRGEYPENLHYCVPAEQEILKERFYIYTVARAWKYHENNNPYRKSVTSNTPSNERSSIPEIINSGGEKEEDKIHQSEQYSLPVSPEAHQEPPMTSSLSQPVGNEQSPTHGGASTIKPTSVQSRSQPSRTGELVVEIENIDTIAVFSAMTEAAISAPSSSRIASPELNMDSTSRFSAINVPRPLPSPQQQGTGSKRRADWDDEYEPPVAKRQAKNKQEISQTPTNKPSTRGKRAVQNMDEEEPFQTTTNKVQATERQTVYQSSKAYGTKDQAVNQQQVFHIHGEQLSSMLKLTEGKDGPSCSRRPTPDDQTLTNAEDAQPGPTVNSCAQRLDLDPPEQTQGASSETVPNEEPQPAPSFCREPRRLLRGEVPRDAQAPDSLVRHRSIEVTVASELQSQRDTPGTRDAPVDKSGQNQINAPPTSGIRATERAGVHSDMEALEIQDDAASERDQRRQHSIREALRGCDGPPWDHFTCMTCHLRRPHPGYTAKNIALFKKYDYCDRCASCMHPEDLANMIGRRVRKANAMSKSPLPHTQQIRNTDTVQNTQDTSRGYLNTPKGDTHESSLTCFTSVGSTESGHLDSQPTVETPVSLKRKHPHDLLSSGAPATRASQTTREPNSSSKSGPINTVSTNGITAAGNSTLQLNITKSRDEITSRSSPRHPLRLVFKCIQCNLDRQYPQAHHLQGLLATDLCDMCISGMTGQDPENEIEPHATVRKNPIEYDEDDEREFNIAHDMPAGCPITPEASLSAANLSCDSHQNTGIGPSSATNKALYAASSNGASMPATASTMDIMPTHSTVPPAKPAQSTIEEEELVPTIAPSSTALTQQDRGAEPPNTPNNLVPTTSSILNSVSGPNGMDAAKTAGAQTPVRPSQPASATNEMQERYQQVLAKTEVQLDLGQDAEDSWISLQDCLTRDKLYEALENEVGDQLPCRQIGNDMVPQDVRLESRYLKKPIVIRKRGSGYTYAKLPELLLKELESAESEPDKIEIYLTFKGET